MRTPENDLLCVISFPLPLRGRRAVIDWKRKRVDVSTLVLSTSREEPK